MPGATRLGDITTGHGAFPPRPSITGDLKVLVDEIPVVRVGDFYAVHCDPTPVCHPGVGIVGQPKVLVSELPIMRMFDPVSCGDIVAIGSAKVIVD